MADTYQFRDFAKSHEKAEQFLRSNNKRPPSPGSKGTFFTGSIIGCISILVVAPWSGWGLLVPIAISGFAAAFLYWEEQSYRERVMRIAREIDEADQARDTLLAKRATHF